jgi:hypothetical protein
LSKLKVIEENMSVSKKSNFRLLLVASFVMVLLFQSCGNKGNNKESATPNEALTQQAIDAGIPILEDGMIPPTTPVWIEGTTFTKESKDATIIARSQALDFIYRQAVEDQGEELAGQLTMRMIVYPDGTTGSHEIIDSKWNIEGNDHITDQMVDIITQWTFPPGLENPIVIQQPWRFIK